MICTLVGGIVGSSVIYGVCAFYKVDLRTISLVIVLSGGALGFGVIVATVSVLARIGHVQGVGSDLSGCAAVVVVAGTSAGWRLLEISGTTAIAVGGIYQMVASTTKSRMRQRTPVRRFSPLGDMGLLNPA